MFDGKVAIVTGGSRGIGAAAARMLGQRGARVVVNYVQNRDAAMGVVAAIEGQGGEAFAAQADVRDESQAAALVQAAVDRYGRVDILVSNAGPSFQPRSFADLQWSELISKVDGELHAAYALTKAVLPVMKQQRYGRLVYVASNVTRRPVPGMIHHAVSKSALITLVQYLAAEVGPLGITANIVSPSLVPTDHTAPRLGQAAERTIAGTPLGRLATTEDVAGAITFFASDDASFLTGVNTPVNGGQVIG